MSKNYLIPLIALAFTLAGCNSNESDPSTVDKQIYDQAINDSNVKLCETVQDEALKTECQEIVEGNLILKTALEESTIEKCKTIKNSQIQESCIVQVNSQLEESNKLTTTLDDRAKFTEQASKKKDPKICLNIDDINFQAECIMFVSGGFEGIKEKSVCELFEHEYYKKECQKNFK